MPEHCRFLLIPLVAGCVLAAPASASQFGFLKGSAKPVFKAFKDRQGRFSLESPKDWQIAPGAGGVLFTITQKKGEAAFVIERIELNQALAPAEVTEVFAEIEVDALQKREPEATAVSSQFVNRGLPKIVIDYTRVGLFGPERARQYSFPIGQELYRFTFSAPTTLFAKYDSVFAHVAGSFEPAVSGPGSFE
jgi:hypothetical protein